MNLEEYEKNKYREIWKSVNYESMSVGPFAALLNEMIPVGSSILEIGCGNGALMKILSEKYSNVSGTDITTEAAIKNGLKEEVLYEKPMWKLADYPHFLHDYTVSADVLEHIPTEKTDEAIQAIIHSTRIGTIHAICTRPASTKYNGEQVHLTVRPLWWWRQKFEKFNTKGIKISIFNTNEL